MWLCCSLTLNQIQFLKFGVESNRWTNSSRKIIFFFYSQLVFLFDGVVVFYLSPNAIIAQAICHKNENTQIIRENKVAINKQSQRMSWFHPIHVKIGHKFSQPSLLSTTYGTSDQRPSIRMNKTNIFLIMLWHQWKNALLSFAYRFAICQHTFLLTHSNNNRWQNLLLWGWKIHRWTLLLSQRKL